MATNNILPFCPTDSGTNLLTQVEYAAATDRTIGNQPGIASSKLVNKAIRQAAFICSQFAQFCADKTTINVLDNGDTATLLATINSALAAPTSARYSENLGLSCSVATNALTISLKTSTSGAPSAASPVKLAFRNSTSATGDYSIQSVTAPLTVVVPASATLGQASALSQYVWVYAIYDGSTVQLGVSGVSVFDDGSVQSTTAISSGSTSGSVLYSTTGVSSKAIRLIGRLLVSETVAGTWASAPSEVTLMPVPRYSTSDWVAWTPSSTQSGWGTISVSHARWKRIGDSMRVQVRFTAGTVTGSEARFEIPSGTIASWVTTSSVVGVCAKSTTTVNDYAMLAQPGNAYLNFGASRDAASAGNIVAATASSLGAVNSQVVGFDAEFPITGWSAYGP